MTLPVSGPISLSQVNVELGLSATATISMNQTNVRTLFQKPTPNSTISMSDGYGKSNGVSVEFKIYGGQGANGIGGGGLGGYTSWVGVVPPGTVITAYVGKQPSAGSAVLIGGTLIAVAGAGGSGGIASGGISDAGGSGGGSYGLSGGASIGTAATGGTQSANGSGGAIGSYVGFAGSGINGGNAGAYSYSGFTSTQFGYGNSGAWPANSSGGVGGPGGGGYYGGGGGAGYYDGRSNYGQGGGGGSGYARTTGLPTGVTYTSSSLNTGIRSGNGQILVYKNGVLATTLNATTSTQTYTIT